MIYGSGFTEMLLFPGRVKPLSVNSTFTFNFEFRFYIHTYLTYNTYIQAFWNVFFWKKKRKFKLSFLNPLYKLCQICVYMITSFCFRYNTGSTMRKAKVSWWWSEWCQLVWLTVDKTVTYWQWKRQL